jgi:acetate kinase
MLEQKSGVLGITEYCCEARKLGKRKDRKRTEYVEIPWAKKGL